MIGWLLLSGCLLGPAPDASPPGCFEHLWADFDDRYALFEVKEIDWAAEGERWRGTLDAGSSDAALYEALVGLTAPLNDNHMHLLAPGFDDWTAGVLQDTPRDDFRAEITREAYVSGLAQPHPDLAWGWLEGGLGYVHVDRLSDAGVAEALDEALAGLADAPGLVLDLRDNGGGYHEVLEPVAARFTASAYDYAQIRRRVEGGGFDGWRTYDVDPAGGAAWTRPVAVLTHRYTISGAEILAMALRELDHVALVGAPTSGAFSAGVWRDLPNGWLYSISVEDLRDAGGQSWEGIGILPDVEVEAGLEDLEAGRDPALEAAAALLADETG